MSERTPQVEDGYTRLANALIESLARARLNGRELSVALAVVRLTYGFQKRSDRIAASQLASLTGIPAKKIGPLLASLEAKHVLVVERRGSGRIPTLGIDKRTTRWPMRDATYPQAGVAQPTPKRGEVSAQPTPKRGVQPTPTRGDTKERKKVGDDGAESGSAFDDVTPLLTNAELDRMIDRYPGGVTYTRDEVRAWVIAKWPDVLDYVHPKTKQPYAIPKRGLATWWKRVTRAEVNDAMSAALARRAAAKLAEPIPDIDEVQFEEFVREMRKVGF